MRFLWRFDDALADWLRVVSSITTDSRTVSFATSPSKAQLAGLPMDDVVRRNASPRRASFAPVGGNGWQREHEEATVMASGAVIDRERERVREIRDDLSGWRRWGPYVSDRSWGTVREDYSHDGNAWAYLTYDKARAKAYRWGEDGIAGLCDRYQLLCFAPAFWNERDPHLKERLFGVNPYEGNHGEDVKEYYFHVDNTPSHSYMCLLYKYPQAAFPYRELIEHNQRRAGQDPEYELLDTGVFEGDRYFDIFIEYAKADPEDLAIRITAHNRGPDAAPLHILPTLWFRNTWAWGPPTMASPRYVPPAAPSSGITTKLGGWS
jgi:hypothetical protein